MDEELHFEEHDYGVYDMKDTHDIGRIIDVLEQGIRAFHQSSQYLIGSIARLEHSNHTDTC
jgi:hypothetical protein